MTYKTILLHISDRRRASRLLDAAIPLARAMEAHLVALAVKPPFVVVPAMDGAGVSMTVDEHRVAYQAEMQALRETFSGVTRGQLLQTEWREADAGFVNVSETVTEHGRSCDLIVLSQKDPGWVYSNFMEEPDRVATESGRPVLVIPNSGKTVVPPKRVTLAWNGRREATRAVYDALPLLQQADEVDLLWINPEKDQPHAGDLPGADISTALSRHGIKCQVSQASAIGADVGSELLRHAGVTGADLLVMGCYGHSRLREFVLGGASRHVLSHMMCPVLMSH
jgi:nucleotide-binding universal stress UspA family protein